MSEDFSDSVGLTLKEFSMRLGKLNCRGEMGCKFPVDAGLVCDDASVTAVVLRCTMKWAV